MHRLLRHSFPPHPGHKACQRRPSQRLGGWKLSESVLLNMAWSLSFCLLGERYECFCGGGCKIFFSMAEQISRASLGPEAEKQTQLGMCLRAFLEVLVMGPLDSGAGGRGCSMGPYFVYGISLVCIGVQIRGPFYGPMGKPLECGTCPVLLQARVPRPLVSPDHARGLVPHRASACRVSVSKCQGRLRLTDMLRKRGYICIYVHTNIIYIYMYTFIHIYILIYLWMYIHTYRCIYIYIYTHACMCICVPSLSSISLSLSLYLHLSISLSIVLPTCLSINLFKLPTYLPTYRPTYLSISLSVKDSPYLHLPSVGDAAIRRPGAGPAEGRERTGEPRDPSQGIQEPLT